MKKIIIYIMVSVLCVLALAASVSQPRQSTSVLNTSIDTPNGPVSAGVDPRAVDSLTSNVETKEESPTSEPTATPTPTVQPKPITS